MKPPPVYHKWDWLLIIIIIGVIVSAVCFFSGCASQGARGGGAALGAGRQSASGNKLEKLVRDIGDRVEEVRSDYKKTQDDIDEIKTSMDLVQKGVLNIQKTDINSGKYLFWGIAVLGTLATIGILAVMLAPIYANKRQLNQLAGKGLVDRRNSGKVPR